MGDHTFDAEQAEKLDAAATSPQNQGFKIQQAAT